MATHVTMGGSGALFVGEDKDCELELLSRTGVPVDMTDWNVRLLVVSAKGAILIDKTATITGSYSVTAATNTQRALVTLTDTEMGIPEGVHQHSWKRTNDGSETILAYGPCIVERTTQV